MKEQKSIKIGQRIREAREKKGLTQKELGDSIKSAPTTISSWETGRTQPKVDDLYLIEKALKVNFDLPYQNDEKNEMLNFYVKKNENVYVRMFNPKPIARGTYFFMVVLLFMNIYLKNNSINAISFILVILYLMFETMFTIGYKKKESITIEGNHEVIYISTESIKEIRKFRVQYSLMLYISWILSMFVLISSIVVMNIEISGWADMIFGAIIVFQFIIYLLGVIVFLRNKINKIKNIDRNLNLWIYNLINGFNSLMFVLFSICYISCENCFDNDFSKYYVPIIMLINVLIGYILPFEIYRFYDKYKYMIQKKE